MGLAAPHLDRVGGYQWDWGIYCLYPPAVRWTCNDYLTVGDLKIYKGGGIILELICKGLIEWLSTLFLEAAEYFINQLLWVFSADLTYFRQRIPVFDEIAQILLATGWAILIGNLAFQALRSMLSGIGMDSEEPQILFTRTFLFAFLLLAGRQICTLGLELTSTVMQMLEVPRAVSYTPVTEANVSELPNAGWLVVVVLNVMIFWQIFRLFLEVGERYVVLVFLTLCAPLAFGCGGSKSTHEIFTGWLRMFVSMCMLMPLGLILVKFLLAALANPPSGAQIIPWAILVTGIARTARRIDDVLTRIGMNPAMTGTPLGNRLPGMLTMMAMRTLGSSMQHAIETMQHSPRTARNPAGSSPHIGAFGSRHSTHTHQQSNTSHAGNQSTVECSSVEHEIHTMPRLPEMQSGQSVMHPLKPLSGAPTIRSGFPSAASAQAFVESSPQTDLNHTPSSVVQVSMPEQRSEILRGSIQKTFGERADETRLDSAPTRPRATPMPRTEPLDTAKDKTMHADTGQTLKEPIATGLQMNMEQ